MSYSWNGLTAPGEHGATTHTVGRKRPGLDNHYYATLRRPNVKVVPYGLAEVQSNSVVAADGSEHEVDVVIFATGFHVVSSLPFADQIGGRSGRTLGEDWGDEPNASLGTSIAGFPNAFMPFGPNSAGPSGFATSEAQVKHLVRAVRTMKLQKLSQIEVKPDVQNALKQECDTRLAGSSWNAGGCSGYCLSPAGTNCFVWPGTMKEFLDRGIAFSLDDYVTTPKLPVSAESRAV